MYGLKEKLMEEKLYLEDVISRTGQQLLLAPEGSLRITNNRKNPQFYHQQYDQVEKKVIGTYLSKKEIELPKRLAQKAYDEKVLALAEKRLQQIEHILKDYADEELEMIYTNLHPARRELVVPLANTWESTVEKWEGESYVGKAFKPDDPEQFSKRGERVRSKSEKILADYFADHNIPYKYEHPLLLEGYGTVYPDFIVLSAKLKKEMIWEHLGMMDDAGYAENALRKLDRYAANGYFPGENLIITYETQHYMLNTRIIEINARRYLI